VTVNVDSTGLTGFIELCKKNEIAPEDIEELLQTNPYSRAISLMGANWGVGSHEKWKAYFMYGLVNDSGELSDEQMRFAAHLNEAHAIPDRLLESNERIEKAINSEEFVRIASKYAFFDSVTNMTIYLLLFGPNAGGNEDMFVDVLLLSDFSEDEITRILAHEFHHIMRKGREADYKIDERYWAIEQALFWFESEGIADLCNFNETSKLYELFGYAKPGQIAESLKNIQQHIETVSCLIKDVFDGSMESNELIQFLIADVKFHSIAYFMAKTICDLSGEDRIKALVGDPYAFLQEYQKVCEENECLRRYAFSYEATQVIAKVFGKVSSAN